MNKLVETADAPREDNICNTQKAWYLRVLSNVCIKCFTGSEDYINKQR